MMDVTVPKPVNNAMLLLIEKDYQAYLVGSSVRKLLMGEKPSKYHISTNATITEIQKVYKPYTTYLCGARNDCLAIQDGKFPMEISQYRGKKNTLEDHLASTDFTMNALAYSDEDGLIDYSTGILDIRNRIIKLNGQDDSLFKDDPVRIIRAIRLSAEYAMKISPETIEFMYENKELLKEVAPERIRDELCKILVTPRADFYIKKYLDIFLEVLPELALMEGFNQNNPKEIYDVLEHTLVSVKSIEPTLNLRLVMLFHDVAKPFTYSKDENGIGTFKNHGIKGAEITREIMNRLKFNKKTIQKVTKLIEYVDYEIPDKDPKVKEFLSKFGIEDLEDLFKIKKANFYAKNPAYVSDMSKIENDYLRVKSLTRKTSFIKKNELRLDGKDLIELGIEQDKVGETLNRIYQMVLRGELKNNRDKLLNYVINNEISHIQEEKLKRVA